jgi:TPR repeat protein
VCPLVDRGESDELIQMQRLQGERGDVNSMLAMGDLLYFGARGLQRDQAEAFMWCVTLVARHAAVAGTRFGSMSHFLRLLFSGAGLWLPCRAVLCRALAPLLAPLPRYRRAADLGDPVGQAACGNMLLKGEGVPKNVTAAIELYQKSAAKDNIRALNGLGFAYYYGDGVEQVRLV